MVAVATRSSGGTPDFELWTVPVSGNVTSGSAWSIIKLADASGDSMLHDVWGDGAGNLCIVGEEKLGSGAVAGVVYKRAP